MNAEQRVPNLTKNQDLTFKLMDNPLLWRVRATEQIQLSSALWTERERVIRSHALERAFPTLVNDTALTGGRNRVWLRLPITMLPRQPLLSFKLTVAGEERHCVPNGVGANWQVRYLAHLVRKILTTSARSGAIVDARALVVDNELRKFLLAIATFDHELWESWKEKRKGDELHRYLNAAGLYGHWLMLKARLWESGSGEKVLMQDVVSRYGRPDIDNPAHNPLLALPGVREMSIAEGFSTSVTTRVGRLLGFLNEADRIARDANHPARKSANELLTRYFEFGRFWVAFSDCLVPLREPFTIVVSEKRVVSFGAEKSSPSVISQTATFRDAISNQVSFAVTDVNVEFDLNRCELKDEMKKAPTPYPEEVFLSEELISIASVSTNRKKRLEIRCHLRSTRPVRWAQVIIMGAILLTGLAIAAVKVGLPQFEQLTAAHLALILAPTTFAGSLMLLRETSALSSAITRAVRCWVAVLLACLWAGVLYLYLTDQIFAPKPVPSHTHSPSSSQAS